MQYTKGLILIFVIVEIFMSSFIIYESSNPNAICITGKNCGVVQNSEYSTFLGIKLSYIGLASSLLLLVIFILTEKNKIKFKYFLYISIIGAFFCLYLIYIQFFVLKTLCSNCLIADTTMIIIAILSIYLIKK